MAAIVEVKAVHVRYDIIDKKTKKKTLSRPKFIGIKVIFDDIDIRLRGETKVEQDDKLIAPHGHWVFWHCKFNTFTIHGPSVPEVEFDFDANGKPMLPKVVKYGKKGLPLCHSDKGTNSKPNGGGGLSIDKLMAWSWGIQALDAIAAKKDEMDKEAAEKAAAEKAEGEMIASLQAMKPAA